MNTTQQSTWIDRGLLLVRVALGVVFIMHGWQKMVVFGHAGVTGFLASIGVPLPGVNAVILTAVEFGGGIALLAGALTRVAAALIGFSMLVATASVHLANGFFMPTGFEYTLTLLLVSLGLTMTGAGKYSVDALIFGGVSETRARHTLKRAA